MVTLIAPRKIAATATASATLARGAHTPVDATSGAKTMTLPTNAPAGVEISVEKVDASANAVTISGTLRGVASSITLTSQYESRTFLSDGAGSWRPTSDHRTAASLSSTFAGYASLARPLVSAGYRARSPFNSSGNVPATVQSNGTNLGGTFRYSDVWQVSGNGPVIEFAIFVNSGATEADNGSDVTISACTLEISIDQKNIPVTFAGQRSATIKSGTTGIVLLRSDPVGVTVKKGQQFWVRTLVSVAGGAKYPVHLIARGDPWGEGFNTDATAAGPGTDMCTFTSTWVATSGNKVNVRMFGPSAVLVNPAAPSSVLAAVTDSIGVGTGESVTFVGALASSADRLDEGWITRAVRDKWPHYIAGLSGTTLASWNAAGAAQSFRRRTVLSTMHFTHLLCQKGINDLQGGDSAATMQGKWITTWSDLAQYGRPVYQSTITPLATTSADHWTTVAGQTVHTNAAARVTANAWLRDGAPMHLSGGAWVADAVGATGASISRCAYYTNSGGNTAYTPASGPTHLLAGMIEASDPIESARDSGKFAAATGARIVNDGTITAATAILTSATANFTADDVGKPVVLVGAGPSGGTTSRWIISRQSATQVTLDGNASTTTTTAETRIGAFGITADGVHPSGSPNANVKGGHEIIATFVAPIMATILGAQSL